MCGVTGWIRSNEYITRNLKVAPVDKKSKSGYQQLSWQGQVMRRDLQNVVIQVWYVEVEDDLRKD